MRRDHPPEEDDQSRQSELSDENIRQAVDNINNPTKRKEETQSEYNAHLAAQVRIQKEEIHKAELKNRKRRLELEAEAKVLRQEEEEFEKKRKSLEKRRSREDVEENSVASRDTDMERTEHYREWLASQNYLDSLREADIRETGKSNIPSRNKRAEYSGMPKHWRSAKAKKRKAEQRNATPGPSRQKGERDKDSNRGHPKGQKDDQPKKSAPPRDKRGGVGMGGGPSEPSGSDDSTSDSSFSTPTETSTDTESSDSSVEEPPEINRNRRSQSRRVSSRRSTGGNERHRDKRRCTRRNPHGSPSDSSDSSGRDGRSHRSRRSHHSNWSGHRDDKSSRCPLQLE